VGVETGKKEPQSGTPAEGISNLKTVVGKKGKARNLRRGEV